MSILQPSPIPFHIAAYDIALIVMTCLVVMVVWRWHLSDDSFKLQQVLVDNVTGKIAIEKVGYMTALAFGTWGMVALIQQQKMTEGYFTAYLGVFALSRAASAGISALKDVGIAKTTSAIPTKD